MGNSNFLIKQLKKSVPENQFSEILQPHFQKQSLITLF